MQLKEEARILLNQPKMIELGDNLAKVFLIDLY